MKNMTKFLPFAFGFLVWTSGLTASDQQSKIQVDATPFEPAYETFFKWEDKYCHPREVMAPKFLYPFEMRRGGMSGEVVVLVQIDAKGKPQRLSVLYGTHSLFIESALKGLEKAQWEAQPNKFGRQDTCFYNKAVFAVDAGS